jgi:hypothetical protein
VQLQRATRRDTYRRGMYEWLVARTKEPGVSWWTQDETSGVDRGGERKLRKGKMVGLIANFN